MPVIDPPKAASDTVIRDLTIPLIGGSAAVLRVPIPLTEENFTLLTSFLATMKAAIVSKPREQPEDD